MPVPRFGCRSRLVRRRGWRDQRAFSLVETLIVCALISTLASLAAGIYVNALKTARVTRAIGDLHAIDVDIRAFHLRHDRLSDHAHRSPPDRAERSLGPSLRLHGPVAEGRPGRARKDGRLNPINSDFDLYSVGEDGQTTTPLTAPASKDDVIRARDGAFVGLAADF